MDTLNSCLWGIGRGFIVQSVIFPLEVIKIRQQCLSAPEKSYRIAWSLFQTHGCTVFYNGFSAKLLQTSVKQAWVWPILTETPRYLKGINPVSQQILTGFALSTLDAGFTTPLERLKVQAANSGKMSLSATFFKEGWRGFMAHWTKLSTNWITFLVAQNYLREKERQNSNPLTLSQLAVIGVKVSLVVSIISAPFDIKNTLKQAEVAPVKDLRRLYRGFPLNTVALIVHNIASVFVMEHLSIARKT